MIPKPQLQVPEAVDTDLVLEEEGNIMRFLDCHLGRKEHFQLHDEAAAKMIGAYAVQ